MNFLYRFSSALSQSIKSNVKGIDEDRLEVINYGLYLFMSDTIKVGIILFIAISQGILLPAVITLLSLGILRTFAGGVHSKTWLGCLSVNCIITFGIVYFSISLSFLQPLLICAVLAPVSFIIFYRYAPSDHENKPIMSNRQRRRLRITSFTLLILQSIIASALAQPYSNIIMFSTIATSISMLPVIYKITANHHSTFGTDEK
ncbi:MAG: accessory gene regulator B family protein [Clostridiaceae bacterium]|nr:accessory gene regulator B family protein [Clostridiaceae bacterium]